MLAICERDGRARGLASDRGAAARGESTRRARCSSGCSSTPTRTRSRATCRTASSAWSRSRWRSRRGRDPAARRAGGRHPVRRERRAVRRDRGAAARRDDPVHRARHGARVPLRRAHHRAGRRQGADRRHAGGDRRRPAREARSTWARRSMAELLARRGRHRRLRRRASCSRTFRSSLERRRQPRAARPQRRGQDDAARHADGTDAGAQRARSAGAAQDLAAVPTHRRAPAGHRLGAAGALHVAVAHRRGAPDARWRGPGRWNARARLRAVPAPGGAARATSATSCPAASSRCWRSRAR